MKFLYLILALLLTVSCGYAEQKVVVITGATSGIGLATAKTFQSQGWKVWAGFRTTPPTELTHSDNIDFCQLDVTDETQIQSAIQNILHKDGRIDVLINNAGYGLIGAEECVTIEEAQHLFDVNFFGAIRLIQAVLPTMRKQNSGHILNISSGVGVHALPGLGIYSASKFALEGLSESLAATLAHWNIKVAIIEPGYVKNDWGKHCLIGTRSCSEPFYQKLTQGISQMLSVPKGQPTEEVAALLLSITENPQPQIRYQTSHNMEEWIGTKLKDPTGTQAYQENLQFLEHQIN